jgi:hypothetical protein
MEANVVAALIGSIGAITAAVITVAFSRGPSPRDAALAERPAEIDRPGSADRMPRAGPNDSRRIIPSRTLTRVFAVLITGLGSGLLARAFARLQLSQVEIDEFGYGAGLAAIGILFLLLSLRE